MIKFRIFFEDMWWANNDAGTMVGSSGVGAMMGSSDGETINGKQRRGATFGSMPLNQSGSNGIRALEGEL